MFSGYLILTADLENSPAETSIFKIPITKELHKKLAPGMFLSFIDTQEKQRYLKIEKALSSSDWLVSCDKAAYLVSGCKLKLLTSLGNTFIKESYQATETKYSRRHIVKMEYHHRRKQS